MKRSFMKKGFGAFFFIVVFLFQMAEASWRPQEKLVEVELQSPQQFQMLLQKKFEIDRIQGTAVRIYVIPEELETLRELGFKPRILIDDLEIYSNTLLSKGTLANYHDYYSTLALVDSLLGQFPDLIQKVTYGQSLQGRELYAVKISDNVQVDEPEPEISFDGCHHGDEVMSSEVIILLMRELCTQYGTNAQITQLVNTREIWIYPFINPDGRQALTRYNAAGVDVNRDWGYMWDGWGGSTAPFSQPESQAGRAWINAHQFVISQSNHGGTEAISYPWSYRPDQAPDHDPIDFLAANYASYSGYPNLPYYQGYSGMYAINGSAKDAFYGLMGAVGWTMEVSNLKHPIPSYISQYYSWNKPAMLYLIDMAGKGIKGMVTDANTGLPVANAIVWVQDATRHYWPVYADPQVGDFHKFLLPGTYTVKITANGYQPATITNVVVSDTGATPVNVQLQSQLGTYAYRVVYCRIPNNNFNDEGATWAALGEPDGVNYSLGVDGYIVLDMGETIQDYSGNDFRVIEGDNSAEGYTVKVSTGWNGPWTTIGNGNGTQDFDLSVSGVSEFRYIRIEDDGDGFANASDAGFDLDAVEGRLIPPTGPFVTINGYTINDSTGNHNGILEAGETVQLSIALENLGVDVAQNCAVTITSNSAYLTVLSDSAFVGNIASGGSAHAGPFVISVDSSTAHGSYLNLQVQVSAAGGYLWNQVLKLYVRQGARILTDYQHIDFPVTFVNFTTEIPLQISNVGTDTLHVWQLATTLAQFGTDTTHLNVAPGEYATVQVQFTPDDTLFYQDTLQLLTSDPVHPVVSIPLTGRGALAPDIAFSPDSFAVQLLPTDSLVVPLSIMNQGAGELAFTAQIGSYPGQKEHKGGGGNDSFGHVWIDSDEPGGPQFDWVELSTGSGTQIPLSGLNSISNSLPLGFSMPFYADTFSTVRVCNNGWISFTAFTVSYNNTPLPNILAPRAMIAPLWDNLYLQSDSRVFYWQDGNRFIVEWENVYTATGHGPYTFEVILYDNGNILMQYLQLNNLEDAYTVGMQNSTADDGFYIAYNEPYLHDNLAILIQRRSWISVFPMGGVLQPGEQMNLNVTFKTENFPLGNFWASVEIHSNDPDESLLKIPVHMVVDSVSVIADGGEVPHRFVLEQNYPNPFNPTTLIRFQLPEASEVSLVIYNIRGQAVRHLVSGRKSAGFHQVVWDGTNDRGIPVASGVYLYRLKAGEHRFSRKMMLLR